MFVILFTSQADGGIDSGGPSCRCETGRNRQEQAGCDGDGDGSDRETHRRAEHAVSDEAYDAGTGEQSESGSRNGEHCGFGHDLSRN
jgi:hypothetical protein